MFRSTTQLLLNSHLRHLIQDILIWLHQILTLNHMNHLVNWSKNHPLWTCLGILLNKCTQEINLPQMPCSAETLKCATFMALKWIFLMKLDEHDDVMNTRQSLLIKDIFHSNCLHWSNQNISHQCSFLGMVWYIVNVSSCKWILQKMWWKRVMESYFRRTEWQLADFLTKAFLGERSLFILLLLGMKCLSPESVKSLPDEYEE